MVKIDFVQCHCHSCNSRRDAHSKVSSLVEQAVKNNQKAVALTDHGVMHGIPELYREARKAGIKAISGFEGYMTKGHRGEPSKHYHQILIAKNEAGFKNLMKLSSEAFLTGFYNKPRFDWELLEKHSEGIIATSSCLAGMIPQAILNGELREARELAKRFHSIFGDDYYLEIQPTPFPEQDLVNKEIVKMSHELGIELLATCDVHYASADDKEAHMGMLCLGRAQKMNEEKPPQYDGEEHYYMKTAKEVFTDFVSQGHSKEDVINAINNTGKLADKVNFELTKEKDHLPEFPLPEGHTDHDKYLGALVKEGLIRKVPTITQEYIDRIKFELGVIREKGYQDYFLIVSDTIRWCKRNNILISPGRGSGAGSLVAFLLDITEVDPIEHNLFFERFLDITRSKMPDIDSDIADNRRAEVIQYLRDKYGNHRVSRIINYGTMTAKLAMKNALMVFDIPFGKSQEISNLIPDQLGITLEEAFKLEPKLNQVRKTSVQDSKGNKVPVDRIFSMAERFEGVVDKFSIHAGGVLITPDDTTNYFPVYTSGDQIVTQWDKDDIEELGGVKFDFLGLQTLRTIESCINSIKNERGIDLDIIGIMRKADDSKVYERISKGMTANSFQFNSEGMRQLCKSVKPTEFRHLVAINALYRPPALASGDTWRYARIKNGEEEERYSHPEEKLITGETFGVITYQEHVMQLVHHFAGWDYGRGDKLRKASREQLEAMRDEFVRDCFANGYGSYSEEMNELWTRIVNYMGYGFNKSHGVSYTMLSYLTVWLETYYPEHWMAAVMTTKMGDQDKLAQVLQDVKREGFEFLAPDINLSGTDFTANKGKIIFPLGSVKGVGDGAVIEILDKKPFSSLEDLMERCNLRTLTKRAMEPLIFAGAFDSLYPELTRKDVFIKYLELKKEAKKKREEAKQMDWNEAIMAEHEKELIGVYITHHPMDKYNFRLWREYAQGQQGCLIGGKVSKVKTFNDKKGNRMAFASIDTQEGVREIVVFASTFSGKTQELLKKGNMVMIEGKKDGEKLLANKLKELV
ncbi:DnaE-like DNA polymerase III alpha [Bacillus phage 268TH004]|uniref:DNA-directed DNA polymerase n=1 Tax=Bacillus phage 268TH004 TaxID=2801523 RepID=A0A7T7ZAM2_9CAUD|nr:DnaE-like DNA polymerase III alpha [Bacillus phage 268TH004]